MSPAALILRTLIRCYRTVLSPVLPPSCRFFPSCSEYALEAVAEHGAIRGGRMAVWRLLRCHPWGGWGHDPVPARKAGCDHDHHHGRLHRPERI